MDKKNTKILNLLAENSRLSWQDIGKQVHLTGQAVAARVRQLEDEGTIKGYTLRQGDLQIHVITVFMNSTQFGEFEQFLSDTPCVKQAYKTSGEGCYNLTVGVQSTDQLDEFLNALLKYARYRVASAIRTIK